MAHPQISVIIPTYNRAAYILEAVESAMRQTCKADEIIVVDDGSTDETARILAPLALQIRYLHQQNRGVGAARNAGAAVARGEYLAFLDSDDIWIEDKLERQIEAFRRFPETDAVYGHAEQFVSPEVDGESRTRLRHMAGKVLPMPTAGLMMIRRSAFESVGPFDESLRIGVEMEWYARLCDLGLKTAMLDAALCRRRLHKSNLNITHADEQSERLRVLKLTLDRRRRANVQTSR